MESMLAGVNPFSLGIRAAFTERLDVAEDGTDRRAEYTGRGVAFWFGEGCAVYIAMPQRHKNSV